jgi:hypothetical protein
MTKPTVAKRVPMVILLGKVVVIQAVPATLGFVKGLALMTVYPAGQERATCKV